MRRCSARRSTTRDSATSDAAPRRHSTARSPWRVTSCEVDADAPDRDRFRRRFRRTRSAAAGRRGTNAMRTSSAFHLFSDCTRRTTLPIR